MKEDRGHREQQLQLKKEAKEEPQHDGELGDIHDESKNTSSD